MTLRQLVIQWNNTWAYDLWYRHKHSIRFNSAEHREASQVDIAFEYLETKIEEQEYKRYQADKDNEAWLTKHQGEWLRPSDNKDRDDELFANLKLEDL